MSPLLRIAALILAAAVANLAAPPNAAAETLTIGPIESPAELDTAVEAMRLLLENDSESMSGVLAARVGPNTGKSDYTLTGKAEIVGTYMVLSMTIAPADTSAGAPVTAKRRAFRGQVGMLAEVAAEEIEKATELSLRRPNPLALSDIEPFAVARSYLDRGDAKDAAAAIVAGDRSTARSLAGAVRVTNEILDYDGLDIPSKLKVAAAFDLFDRAQPLIDQLPAKEQKKWTQLFGGRRKLVRLDTKGALESMKDLSDSGLSAAQIGLAKAAKKTKDEKSRVAAIRSMLSADPPDPAAASYLASLSPDDIPPGLAPDLKKMSEALSDEHPALASQLAVQSGGDALANIDPYSLSPKDAMRAAEQIAAGGALSPTDSRMMVDLNMAAGNMEQALALSQSALRAAPESPELLTQAQAMAAMDSELGLNTAEAEAAGGGKMNALQANKMLKKAAGAAEKTKEGDKKKATTTTLEEIAENEPMEIPWIPLGAGIAVIALLVYIGRRRASGSITVRIKAESSTQNYLNLTVNKSAKPPGLGDAKAFLDNLKTNGHTMKARSATYVDSNAKFPVISPGKCFVHLFGVLVDEGELIPITRTEQIEVTGDKTNYVTFDLVPTEAEFRVRVTGPKGAAVGARVWIGDNAQAARYSDKDGRVTVSTPPGDHVLHVEYQGDTLEHRLVATSVGRHDLEINLERQKRMNELADGIAIEGFEQEDEIPAEYRATTPRASSSHTNVEEPKDDFSVFIGDSAEVDSDTSGNIPLDLTGDTVEKRRGS